MADKPHEFKPFPNPSQHGNACVRCGRLKDHPIHK